MSDTDTDVDEREIPLLDPDAKVLSEVQEEFVKPHIDWCPVQIKLEKVVTTTTEHTCCWRTDDDHKIILGGEGCLTVSRNNGVEKVYKLWNIDLRVISGIAITSEKQLICVEDLYSNTKEVHTVNIPNGLPDEIELHCVNTLDIMDPVCLFVFDKLRYGVLCENSRIECYTLKNILLDREPAPSELIKLDIDISGMDTACATPDGNMVVTSTDNRCFHIYNINGDLLNTFSPSNTWNLDDDWHQIFWDGEQHRLFVQCFAEGVILASDNRVICTLKDGKCVREEAGDDAKSLTNISFCVSSEERMWVINGDTRNEVHIYTCDQESMAQAKTGRRKQCQPIAILEPNNGLCPREIIYSKTIHTKNEHNLCWESGDDDQIFLGGRNTITLLRNDETKITYHLWDHNLDVISALALTRAKQLICIKDHQDQTTAHVLDLTEDIKDGAQLSALTKLTVSDPIYIFAVNKMAYGILCRPKRIAVFTLRDILLDENPKVAQIIKVEFEISDQDTACATPDDKYCVTSWLYTAITIYNAGSELVYICNLDIMVGSGRENWLRIFLDRQCHRLFVQYCKDKIVVVSDNGFVCSLKDEQWDNVYIGNTELVENIGAVKHCVFGNKRMWCVGLDKKSVHVYDHATSQSVKTDHETTMRYVRQQAQSQFKPCTGNDRYSHSSDQMTWADADNYCKSIGMALPHAATSEEAKELFEYQNFAGLDGYIWTGANDFDDEGNFVFSDDGEAIDGAMWREGYEPNGGADENCVLVAQTTRKWADYKCSNLNLVICMDVEPKICSDNARYVHAAEKMQWSDADNYCKGKGMALPHAATGEEAKELFAYQNYAKLAGYIWTGANDLEDEGNFVFSDNGEAIDGSMWREGYEPNGGTGENCVLVAQTTRKWADYKCSNVNLVICTDAQ